MLVDDERRKYLANSNNGRSEAVAKENRGEHLIMVRAARREE